MSVKGEIQDNLAPCGSRSPVYGDAGSHVPQTFRNLGVKSGKTCSQTCLNAWENCGIYYIGIHFLLEIVLIM